MKTWKGVNLFAILTIFSIVGFASCVSTKYNERFGVLDKSTPIKEQCLLVGAGGAYNRGIFEYEDSGVNIVAVDGKRLEDIGTGWEYPKYREFPKYNLIPAGEHTITGYYHHYETVGYYTEHHYSEGTTTYERIRTYDIPFEITYNFSAGKKYMVYSTRNKDTRMVDEINIRETDKGSGYLRNARFYHRNAYETRYTRYIGYLYAFDPDYNYSYDEETPYRVFKDIYVPAHDLEFAFEEELGFTFINKNYHPWMRVATNLGAYWGLPLPADYIYGKSEDGTDLYVGSYFSLGYNVGGLVYFLPTKNFGINLGGGLNGDFPLKGFTPEVDYRSLGPRPYARFGLTHMFNTVDVNYYVDYFIGEYMKEDFGGRVGLILKF